MQKQLKSLCVSVACLCAVFACHVNAQTTAFTYQGKLTDGAGPANGNYDFQFRLFDALSAGTQVGTTQSPTGVAVSSGVFSVSLDFGAAAFPGANRWLEISVRLAGGGAFTMLSPRQPMTATPYAIQSLNATNATNATTAVNFSGALTGDVTGTQSATAIANNAVTTAKLADGSVTDAKIVAVSGGKVTSTVANATNAVNATTATNATNATNAANATTAVNFSGALTGDVTGNQGTTAVAKLRGQTLAATAPASGQVLKFNGTTNQWEPGTDNNSGGTVTNVSASSPLASSGGATPNLSLSGVIPLANGGTNAVTAAAARVNLGAAASGANADITALSGLTTPLSVVQGGTGLSATGAAANYLRSNGTGWTSSALQMADVPDLGASYIKNATSLQAASNFNISGNGTVGGMLNANVVSATTQYNLAGTRALFASGPYDNGLTATLSNTFLGESAGLNTTPHPTLNHFEGKLNSFFGVDAGKLNTTGFANSFVGAFAGASNTTGSDNNFFGEQAGYFNTTGSFNNFFGNGTGLSNTTGDSNSFFGDTAGYSNTIGAENSFFGSVAGFSNTTGNRNVALGTAADFRSNAATSGSAVGGDENIFLGYQAGGNSTRRNATAIGANAFVGCDDCMVLGNSAVAAYKVGIGTNTPLDKLHVSGELRVNSCVKNVFGTQIAGTCSSDLRLKRDITPFPHLLDKVARLRPVNFYWRSNEFPQYHFGAEPAYGLIAQEVEAVLPELVSTDEQGFKAVNYSKLPLLTLQAVKELKAENDALKQQNSKLENRLAALEQMMQQLKVQAEKLQPKQ